MSHRDCEKDPCQLCKRRESGETCGSCYAGLCLMEVSMGHYEVERCDVCALFETDEDAADAVRVLLQLLHKVYKRGLRLGNFSVADAVQVVRMDVLNAPVLRRRAAVIINKADADRDLLARFARDVVKGAQS